MTSPFHSALGHTATHKYASFGSPEKKFTEIKKIFCAYHSTEFLTNFCREKQCLMPLCPTCVVEHTEQHYQANQKPSYVNLNEALHETRQICQNHVTKLEQLGRKNKEIINFLNGLPEYIRKQISACKSILLGKIEEAFQSYEVKLVDQIKQKYSKQGVYGRRQCEEMREYINKQVQTLMDRIVKLKGDQSLAALIRFYEGDQEVMEEQITEIIQHMQRNKKAGGLYGISKLIEGCCEKTVLVEYIQEDLEKLINSGQVENSASDKKVPAWHRGVSPLSKSGNFRSDQKEKSGTKLISSRGYSSNKREESKHQYYYTPIRD